MMCRNMMIVLGLVALVTCLACTSQSRANMEAYKHAQEAQEEAEKLLVSSPETQSCWDMKDFHVFGRGDLLGFDIAAGTTAEVKKIADSPETFAVTIPLWVEGHDPSGKPIKLSRTLYVEIVEGERSQWQAQNCEFRDDRPLTFWRQLRTWLFWSFIGPVLVASWFAFQGGRDFSEKVGCARVGASILALPIAGYSAHVCFGSTTAVIVGIIAYIVISCIMLALLMAIISG
jgi:hypothetical protein